MKRYILLSIVLLSVMYLLTGCSSAYNEENVHPEDFLFNIKMDKTEYKVGEAIIIEIEVKNFSDLPNSILLFEEKYVEHF